VDRCAILFDRSVTTAFQFIHLSFQDNSDVVTIFFHSDNLLIVLNSDVKCSEGMF
jgi:hypothetical protein